MGSQIAPNVEQVASSHRSGEFQSEAAELASLWQRILERFDPNDTRLRSRVIRSLASASDLRGVWLMLRWLDHGPVSLAHTLLYFDAVARVARYGSPHVRERALDWLVDAAKSGLHSRSAVIAVLVDCYRSASGLTRARLARSLRALGAAAG